MDKLTGDYVKNCYAREAKDYREVSDPDVLMHQGVMVHVKDLSEICLGFKKNINVLDLCCGTGRYFHALKNVNLLVGLDFSSSMLKQAQSPVNSDSLDIKSIRLICADVHAIDKIFKPNVQFDLIYSIGALGEYTFLDLELLDAVYQLLLPGGQIYLTTVKRPETFKIGLMKILRRLRETIGRMDRDLIFTKYALNDQELKALLERSKFKDCKIKTVLHKTHTHNVIMAQK